MTARPAWMVYAVALTDEAYAASREARRLTALSTFAEPEQARQWLADADQYRRAADVLMDLALSVLDAHGVAGVRT